MLVRTNGLGGHLGRVVGVSAAANTLNSGVSSPPEASVSSLNDP